MKKIIIIGMKVFAIIVLVLGLYSAFTMNMDQIPRMVQLFVDPSLIGVLQGLIVVVSVLVCILLLGFAIHLENQEIIAAELKQLNAKVQHIEKMDDQDTSASE